MKFNVKLFLILWILCLVGVITVIPYQLSLLGGIEGLGVPIYVIYLAAIIQSSILFGLAIFIGLLISERTGLGAPILEGWLSGEKVLSKFKSILMPSIGLGLLAGVLILVLDYLLAVSFFGGAILLKSGAPSALEGFLSSFYGGINEEILLRLFLMNLLVLITIKIQRRTNKDPSKIGVWLSIILASLIFGAGHLPTVAAMGPLTIAVVLRILLLNGVGGIIFGWLFWKKGLESAIIAHFTADIILHVITVLMITV